MPKITAPVQRFLAIAGDHVRQGQLVAVFENRDLVAAAAANKGQVDQAQANLRKQSGQRFPSRWSRPSRTYRARRKLPTRLARCSKAASSSYRKGARTQAGRRRGRRVRGGEGAVADGGRTSATCRARNPGPNRYGPRASGNRSRSVPLGRSAGRVLGDSQPRNGRRCRSPAVSR